MLKILSYFQKNIIFISLLLLGSVHAQIVFVPFKNESTFKGKWNISEDIPNFLAAYMRDLNRADVLSSTAFISLLKEEERTPAVYSDIEFLDDMLDEWEYNYAMLGTINSFGIARFNAGEPHLGGFESFSCGIEISVKIYNKLTNNIVFSEKIEGSVTRNTLGLNLFGKPSDDKEQFYGLDKIKFGSEDFAKTIVNDALLKLGEELVNRITEVDKSILRTSEVVTENKFETLDKTLNDITIKTDIVKGELLTYDEETGEAFISLGSAHKLKIGEEFGIYTEGDSLFDSKTNEFLGVGEKKVSQLEIVEIRGEKFSLAIVRQNRDKVARGMIVKKIFITQ